MHFEIAPPPPTTKMKPETLLGLRRRNVARDRTCPVGYVNVWKIDYAFCVVKTEKRTWYIRARRAVGDGRRTYAYNTSISWARGWKKKKTNQFSRRILADWAGAIKLWKKYNRTQRYLWERIKTFLPLAYVYMYEIAYRVLKYRRTSDMYPAETPYNHFYTNTTGHMLFIPQISIYIFHICWLVYCIYVFTVSTWTSVGRRLTTRHGDTPSRFPPNRLRAFWRHYCRTCVPKTGPPFSDPRGLPILCGIRVLREFLWRLLLELLLFIAHEISPIGYF